MLVVLIRIVAVLNCMCCVVQENLADEGELLRKDVFSVWNHKKDHRSLRFTSQTRHIFLYERHVVFCKKKDDAPSNADRAVIYTLKNSIPVSHCSQLFIYIYKGNIHVLYTSQPLIGSSWDFTLEQGRSRALK